MKRLLTLLLLFLSFYSNAVSQADLEQGEKIYTEMCVLCHGLAGEGWDWKKKAAKPPVPVPNLKEVIPERTDEYLQAVIKDGGRAVGLSEFMPALGFNLSDQEIQHLISYLRALNQKTQAEGAFFKNHKFGRVQYLVYSSLPEWNSFSQFSSFLQPAVFKGTGAGNRFNYFFNKSKHFDINDWRESILLAHQQDIGNSSGNQRIGGFFPHAISLGDFNSDGNTDFAIPASASQTLTVLLADGAGEIITNNHLHVGEGPTWVTSTDLNQDGHLDLVTTNTGAGSLSLYYGNGKGDFSGRMDIEDIHGPSCVVAGDFNKDGIADLAVAQAALSKVLILTNDYTGLPKKSYTIDVERGPHIMDGVDLNKDGIPDLVVGSLGSHTLSLSLIHI